jgi:hypothetical protein
MERNVARAYAGKAGKAILDACADEKRLAQTPVDEFMDLLVI